MKRASSWLPAEAAAGRVLLAAGFPALAVAMLLRVSPATARKWRRPPPPPLKNASRLKGTILKLRAMRLTRAWIASHLQIPRSLVDRTIDGTPQKLVLHPYHRKPKKPAAPAQADGAAAAVPPEATSPDVEVHELPSEAPEPAAGGAVQPLANAAGDGADAAGVERAQGAA